MNITKNQMRLLFKNEELGEPNAIALEESRF